VAVPAAAVSHTVVELAVEETDTSVGLDWEPFVIGFALAIALALVAALALVVDLDMCLEECSGIAVVQGKVERATPGQSLASLDPLGMPVGFGGCPC
jgi:hypothetical protein